MTSENSTTSQYRQVKNLPILNLQGYTTKKEKTLQIKDTSGGEGVDIYRLIGHNNIRNDQLPTLHHDDRGAVLMLKLRRELKMLKDVMKRMTWEDVKNSLKRLMSVSYWQERVKKAVEEKKFSVPAALAITILYFACGMFMGIVIGDHGRDHAWTHDGTKVVRKGGDIAAQQGLVWRYDDISADEEVTIVCDGAHLFVFGQDGGFDMATIKDIKFENPQLTAKESEDFFNPRGYRGVEVVGTYSHEHSIVYIARGYTVREVIITDTETTIALVGCTKTESAEYTVSGESAILYGGTLQEFLESK